MSLSTFLPTLVLFVQQTTDFTPGAPHGTGLEWMTIAAVVVPALLVVLLVYVGSRTAV